MVSYTFVKLEENPYKLKYLDLLSLNDELPDEILSGNWDNGSSNGLSNGSLDGMVGSSMSTGSSVNNSITTTGMTPSSMGMGMRPGGMGMNPMGTMANPNQNMTLVNALSGKAPGQLTNVRGPAPSSTPNNSISSDTMSSMGGPGMPPQGLVSMAPMNSMASDMNTPASSMGPGQPNMMGGGPMRPGMSMGGMGPGPATIMSGPNTMVRSVGGGMVPGGMNMIRQPGMIQQGQPRMMQAGVRMPIRVSLNISLSSPSILSFSTLAGNWNGADKF